MNISELHEELKKRNINMTAREIAKLWNMDEASYSRKKRLNTEIKYKNLKQLEEKLNINLTKNFKDDNFISSGTNNIIKIPYWDKIPDKLKIPDFTCVTAERDVIKNHWYLNPDNLCIIPMVGDKMSNYWYPMRTGDILIVDTSQNQIMGNGVYFATSQNDTRFWIREMQVLINNDIQIKGYAPSGETTKVFTREQLQDVDFKLIGKVIKNVSFRL